MKIINTLGEVVAGGDKMATKFVKLRHGVQNIDGSHMAARRIFEVPDYFAVQLVGTYRADPSTKEEFDAQGPEDQDADAPKLNIPSLVITPGGPSVTNGDPVVDFGDPKSRKK